MVSSCIAHKFGLDPYREDAGRIFTESGKSKLTSTQLYPESSLYKRKRRGVEEMAQVLKALVALPEGQDLVLSTHIGLLIL